MKKEKTLVLMLSRTFPTTSKKAGQSTFFSDNFLKSKIHTIRTNYNFWKKRIYDVQLGNACLSIRQWSGKPYKSSQIELARLTKKDGVHVQKFEIATSDLFMIDGVIHDNINQIALNDGLQHDDFIEWLGINKGDQFIYEFAIIHFTKYNYND